MLSILKKGRFRGKRLIYFERIEAEVLTRLLTTLYLQVRQKLHAKIKY